MLISNLNANYLTRRGLWTQASNHSDAKSPEQTLIDECVEQLWVVWYDVYCVVWCLYCGQWFEDKTEQLDLLEHDLQDLHASIELLVANRKGVHVYLCHGCYCHVLPVLYWLVKTDSGDDDDDDDNDSDSEDNGYDNDKDTNFIIITIVLIITVVIAYVAAVLLESCLFLLQLLAD